MPDYKKTQAYYTAENFPYTVTADQFHEERFEKNIKRPVFAEGSTTPASYEYRQDKEHPDIHYPLRIPHVIKRIRAIDSKEYILTNRRCSGINQIGDIIYRNADNLECYTETRFEHKAEQDKNDPTLFTKKATGISETIIHYTLEFNEENLEKVWADVPDNLKRTVSLVCKDEGVGGVVRAARNYEEFKSKSLDELLNPPLVQPTVTPETKSKK